MASAFRRGYIYGTCDTILEAVCLMLEPPLLDDGVHDIGSLDIGDTFWLTRDQGKLTPHHLHTGSLRRRPCVRLTSDSDEICLLATFRNCGFLDLPALLQHFLIPVEPNEYCPLGIKKPLPIRSDPRCLSYKGQAKSWLICVPYQSEPERLGAWSLGNRGHPNPYFIPEAAMRWLGHEIQQKKLAWITRLKDDTNLRQQMYDDFIRWYESNKGTPTEYTFPPHHWQPMPTTTTVQATILSTVAASVFLPQSSDASVVYPRSEALADKGQPSITAPLAARPPTPPPPDTSTGPWYFGRIRNQFLHMGLSQTVRGPVLLADNQIKMPTLVVNCPRADSEDELGHATPYGQPSGIYNPPPIRKTQSLGGVGRILRTQLHIPVKITIKPMASRAYKKVVLFCKRWRVRQRSTMMTDFGERRTIRPSEDTSLLGGDVLGSPKSMWEIEEEVQLDT